VLTIYVQLTPPADYNAKVIAEFRANEGRVGGEWEGTPLLLLHHVGAKSGQDRITPMGYLGDDPGYLVIASNGGAPKHPDWYYNLKAQPNVSIEVGAGTIDVTATEATGEERELLFRRLAARYPQLSEFERKTPRAMPVITLTPR
jgi:deazaflavin-dependent oxidoreductase (nitroreductase family)